VARAGTITVAVSAAKAPLLGLDLSLVSAEEQEDASWDSEEDRLLAVWGGDPLEAAVRFRCARRAVANALRLTPREMGAVRVRGMDAAASLVGVVVLPSAGRGETECRERWLVHTARDGDVVLAWMMGERQQP
jgi:hypothetical protein